MWSVIRLSRYVALVGALLLAGCGADQGASELSSTPVASTNVSTATIAPSPTLAVRTPTPAASPTLAATATPLPDTIPTVPPLAGVANPPVRLVVPAIALDLPLVPVGLDADNVPIVPEHDAAWYLYSAKLGEPDNIVLWGHVLRFKHTPDIPAPFARVEELKLGAQLTLYDQAGNARTYAIVRQERVSPENVDVILPQGKEQVTLVSCIGEEVITNNAVTDMTERLVTVAEPVP